MEITEVRIKLVSPGHDKLRAFCSITIDDSFVIRDLKVIEGTKGAFVAMPSRKLTARCPRCSGKNHYRARFCNDCGLRLPQLRDLRGLGGRAKLHADVAHPIHSECRETIQARVLGVYHQELERSQDPDYQPMELEVFDEEYLSDGAYAEDGVEEPAYPQAPVAARDGLYGPAPPSSRLHAARGSGEELVAEEENPPAGDRGWSEKEPWQRPSRPHSLERFDDRQSTPQRREAERRSTFREEPESEPEDNFGAGLFS